MNNKKKVLTEKQALEKPLGTFHHPTKNTYRTGACNIGDILKKGHTKKLKNKEIYVGPTCVINKGKKGIKISEKTNAKILENLKMEKYLKDIKKTSYKSVILKLKSQLRKKDLTASKKKELEKDVELLEIWRINNPNKPVKKKVSPNKNLNVDSVLNKPVKKKVSSNKILNLNSILNKSEKSSTNNEKVFNASLKEFQKNLNTDFLKKKKQTKPKIKQLSTKEILNLIKDN